MNRKNKLLSKNEGLLKKITDIYPGMVGRRNFEIFEI